MLRPLPCGHVFHMGCVDRWLLKNQACPLCLRDITQGAVGVIAIDDVNARSTHMTNNFNARS